MRFGAYHLYLPNLLKPGPRALAAQLWALKEATPDTKGLDEVPHLAASGRTSFPADKDVPKALYRVVGYRVCGERAVRVDILERLADLIRPALAWRPGSPAQKPPGAVEGGGFTVTVNMTSLTGSSGEDFASVLRSLGYRMEKKPKPVGAGAGRRTATESATAEAGARGNDRAGECRDSRCALDCRRGNLAKPAVASRRRRSRRNAMPSRPPLRRPRGSRCRRGRDAPPPPWMLSRKAAAKPLRRRLK